MNAMSNNLTSTRRGSEWSIKPGGEATIAANATANNLNSTRRESAAFAAAAAAAAIGTGTLSSGSSNSGRTAYHRKKSFNYLLSFYEYCKTLYEYCKDDSVSSSSAAAMSVSPSIKYFSQLHSSPASLICKLLFEDGMRPQLVEVLTQKLNLNLTAIMLHNACPRLKLTLTSENERGMAIVGAIKAAGLPLNGRICSSVVLFKI